METEVEVEVTATNRVSAVDATAVLRIVLPGEPVWQADPIPLHVLDYDDTDTYSFDLKPYQYSYPPATYAATTSLFSWESMSRDGVFTVSIRTPGPAQIGNIRTRTIEATNAHGSATKSFTYFVFRTGTPDPRMLEGRIFPVTVGEAFSLDLKPLIGGSPPPRITGLSLVSWMSITNGVLSGTLPRSASEGQLYSVAVSAINRVSTVFIRFMLQVAVPAVPAWTAMTLGDGLATFPYSVDLTDFLRGSPLPTVAFTQGYTAPSWLELDGRILKSTRLPTLARDTDYQIQLTATNTAGSANITLTLRVLVGGCLLYTSPSPRD